MPGNHVCPICYSSFTRSDSMLRHIRRKHPTEESRKINRRTESEENSRFHNELARKETEENNRFHNEVARKESEETKYAFEISNHPLHLLPKVPVGHFLPWKHPFTCLIAGPTGSGKTFFVKRFVQNIRQMVTPVPDRITWCYGEYQTLYAFIDGVDFHEGLPNLKSLDPSLRHLIIIDDLMTEVDATVTSLFTKKSHHRDISVMYIVQNVFHQNKQHRDISLNTHYIVLMKNPRDASQIRRLSQQMFPGGGTLLTEAYEDATSNPHGYLVIDLKQDTHTDHRLRTDIFPGQYQMVYLP